MKTSPLETDPFDLNAFRLSGSSQISTAQRPKKIPRHRPGETFLKGPIPWNWLATAGSLRGKALHVALVLWREAGCRKSPTIRFRISQIADFNFHRDTAHRGLQALKSAKLVNVRHYPGQCLEVTLLEYPLEHH